jgi:hypothetical protein
VAAFLSLTLSFSSSSSLFLSKDTETEETTPVRAADEAEVELEAVDAVTPEVRCHGR